MTGYEVVGAVEYQVRRANQPVKQGVIGPLCYRDHFHIGIEGCDGLHHGLCLKFANSRLGVSNLALQVCCIHPVVVDNGEVSHTGAAQVQRHRRA